MRIACLIALATLGSAASLRAQAPSDTALPRHIQLGASLGSVPDSLKSRGAPAGALVLGVLPGSPAQAAGIRAGDVLTRIANDSVRDIPSALAALRPMRAGGTFQIALWRAGAPLRLRVAARERPRETSTDFVIEYRAVRAPQGKLRVLVTRPRDTAKHPAVLLIGGIGCYSIDQASGVNNYRDLMYHLTRRGYVTVRVEKAGIGDSEGGPCRETDFATEVAGYRAALAGVRRDPAVDTANIFLFGHSIGGIEAPLLAADSAAALRGVAVLSTVGISWYEYELANLRRQLVLGGTPPDSVEREMRLKTICGFHFLIEHENRRELLARDSSCAAHIDYPASDAYMQAVADQTPALLWHRVNLPVLVMWGGSDFITSRDEHVALAAAINAMHAGSGGATFAEIPELDHYLSRQRSQLASFNDSTPGLLRPYFGATLEPVLDDWLSAHAISPADTRARGSP